MPILRADDDVARLRGYWLGPDGSIRWPVDWTYPEWWVFGLTMVATWVITGIGGWFVWGGLGAVKLEQLTLTLLFAIPAGPALGWLAKQRVAPFINSDRRLSWLVAGWLSAARHLWWAHGPIDRAVAGTATGVTLFLFPFTVLLPVRLLWVAVIAYGATQAARWVRDRVESPERLQERTWARLERSAGPVDWTLHVTTDIDVRPGDWPARQPLAPRDRARALADLCWYSARKKLA